MKNILYKLLAIVFVAGMFNSCQEKQEISPVQSTANYPTATFLTTSDLNIISKGDVIVFTITLDRMSDRNIDFGIQIGDGSVATADNFEVTGGSMPAFTSETTLTINVLQDNFPEADKALEMEVGAFVIGQKYLLNPKTVNPKISTQLINVNDPGSLTVVLGWDTDADFDLFSTSVVNGPWGAGGATGANPETDQALWPTDPDGDYFYSFDPWDVPDEVNNYFIRVGHPDGTVDVFEGVINLSTIADDFIVDTDWGFDLYRLITVTHTAGTFVVVNNGN